MRPLSAGGLLAVLLAATGPAQARVRVLNQPPVPGLEKWLPETEKRLKEVFGIDADVEATLDASEVRGCSEPGLRVALARAAFLAARPLFQKRTAGGSRLEHSMFDEGWASYAAQLMLPGRPAWRYVAPCDKDGSRGRRFESLESRIAEAFLKALLSDAPDGSWPAFFAEEVPPGAPWPARGGRWLGYRMARSMERKLDRKMIQLLTFEDFRKELPAWLESARARPR